MATRDDKHYSVDSPRLFEISANLSSAYPEFRDSKKSKLPAARSLNNFVSFVALKPRGLVLYSVNLDYDPSQNAGYLKPRSPDAGKGFLTHRARKRMLSAIDFLLYTAKYKSVFVKSTNTTFRYKVNFITLTLPSQQVHNDTIILKTCLSKFLAAWSARRIGLCYVWKAEVQENGNLHFHVIANAFFHLTKLRTNWNKYVETLGYVSRSISSNPNSTDVHAVKNQQDLGKYLAGYFSKKDLFTKVLKRYHKKYDASHLATTKNVVSLPKNYFAFSLVDGERVFKFLKRRVTCTLWGASSVVKGINVSVPLEYDTQAWLTMNSRLKADDYIAMDFARYFPLQVMDYRKYPEFKKALDTELGALFKMQSSACIKESINSI